MIQIAATKTDAKAAASVAASATHSHEIDTLGFEYVSIDVVYSPFASTTSNAAPVLRLTQHDVTGTGQTNISGFVGGTDFTVAAGTTTGANVNVGYVARFNVDMRGKRRFLTLYTSPGNTVAISSVARLGRAEEAPFSAATKNVGTLVSG
jgi:hypothetical protein